MEAWAIVVAGGSGTRFGGPKQYAALGGRRVLDLAVEGAGMACDGVVVVLPGIDVATAMVDRADAVVGGGQTRSASVRAGLAAVPEGAGVIAVHDAARPLASRALWVAVLAAVASGADGAVPGLPVTDTIKRVAGNRVTRTLDRNHLVATQTPQAFKAAALRAAHATAADTTDDAALVEAAGGLVVVVPGEVHNLKLTEPADLAHAEALLARTQPGRSPGPVREQPARGE